MAYLVRKLNKMDEIFSLCNVEDITTINADIPTTEFRTKNGTLSTWRIDSIADIDNAVLAIAVTSSEITKMDFIIINTDILQKNNLEFKQTYAGQDIAIPDLQDSHYDILDITIGKLINCTKVYQTVAEMDPNGEKLILRYAAGQVMDLLVEAEHNQRLDEKKVSKKIKDQLYKRKSFGN